MRFPDNAPALVPRGKALLVKGEPHPVITHFPLGVKKRVPTVGFEPTTTYARQIVRGLRPGA
jgi:hypothetical protein